MKKIVSILLALMLVVSGLTVALADDGDSIKYGDSGAAVKTIQRQLKAYHYYTGKITGEFDKETLNAVKEFQKYNNLTVDGKVGEKTQLYLKGEIVTPVSAPVKDDTANRTDVKHVQTRLKYYGYYNGKIDGIFGKQSIAAVRAFQSANGLKVDGAVGADTLAKLDSDTAVKKSDIGSTYTKVQLGSTDPFVKTVQKLLWSYGYYDGNWSGVFDSATWNAVKEFQTANNLTADGIVGTRTWAVLSGVPVSKGEAQQENTQAIQSYQQRLADLGWYSGALTGKYDKATVAAVRGFQSASGLKVDGAVGANTYSKLFAADAITKAEAQNQQKVDSHPVIRPGVQGSYVREIQTLLNAKGYSLTVDGKFGAGTTAAVKAFQEANGLKADGKVGKDTWAALLK